MLKWIFAALLAANLVAAMVVAMTPVDSRPNLSVRELNARQIKQLPHGTLPPAPSDVTGKAEATEGAAKDAAVAEAGEPAKTAAEPSAAKAEETAVAEAKPAPTAPAPAVKKDTPAAKAPTPAPAPSADKIAAFAEKPAAEKPAAAHKPEAPAAPAKVCFKWGPFDATQAGKVRDELARIKLAQISEDTVDAKPAAGSKYWVYLPPSSSRDEANKRSADAKDKGFDNYVVGADNQQFRNAVSLGLFSNAAGAEQLKGKLVAAGYKDAAVHARGQGSTTIFRLKSVSPAQADQLTKAGVRWPGRPLKEVACKG